MKKKSVKYNQRIGGLIVKFVDYLKTLPENENETNALEEFSLQNALSANEAYQIAIYLRKQGYRIDPVVFYPERDEDAEITFQEYDNALLRNDYDKAHKIYEAMTPAQKQIIRDRRGHMQQRNIKTAQQADTEAVIEKSVPAEEVGLLKELPKNPSRELDEIITPAEQLINEHNSLNLPPDSMKLFMPFAHSLDELKRVRNNEVPKADLRKATGEFLNNFGKVLHYLDQQDYDVSDLLGLVKKYANLFYMSPTASVAAQKILVLASKLQEKGENELSSRLIKTIAQFENIVEEGEKVVNQSSLVLYQEALQKGEFDKAREIYLHLSPQQRKIADEVASRHFAIQSVVSLYRVGESLFSKGKTKEANEVSDVVKAQFVELPGDMQQEILFIIVPEGGLDQLPQAFKGNNTNKMENVLTDMQKRLTPEVLEEEEIVMPCSHMPMSAKTIMQLLKVADALDQKGETKVADELASLLNNLKKAAQMPTPPPVPVPGQASQPVKPSPSPANVGVLKCQNCGADVFYDKNKPEKPQYCTYCAKMLGSGPWVGQKVAQKTAALPGPYDPYTSVGPLGLSSAEKAREQEARKTRLIDPTGVGGKTVSQPQFVQLLLNDKVVGEMPRKKALDIERTTGKLDVFEDADGTIKAKVLDPSVLEKATAKSKIRSFTKSAAGKDDHGGKPAKVVEIADAIRRDNPGTSDEVAYRMAWENYCSNINPGYEGCTEKGKSHGESPKPYSK